MNHDLGGADFDALAAANALLLVDHVNAGLGILGDGFMLADLHALAALDADTGLGTGALGNDLDAAQVGIEFFIESVGAGTDALQAGHALSILLDSKLLHCRYTPFLDFIVIIIQHETQNSNGQKSVSDKNSIISQIGSSAEIISRVNTPVQAILFLQ